MVALMRVPSFTGLITFFTTFEVSQLFAFNQVLRVSGTGIIVPSSHSFNPGNVGGVAFHVTSGSAVPLIISTGIFLVGLQFFATSGDIVPETGAIAAIRFDSLHQRRSVIIAPFENPVT